MYLVTVEDDDGMWFEEPRGFDTEENARDFLKTAEELSEHHAYVLYRCYEVPLKK